MVLLQGVSACLPVGGGGKRVHVLRSHMCGPDFWMELPFNYTDDDSGDAAFVKAMSFIRGRDAVEEYLACRMHPVFASVGFERVTYGVTPVKRLKLALPNFRVVHKDDKGDIQFLAMVEFEAQSVVGSYTRLEHDACMASLCNKGWLNRVFELAGVLYGPHPVHGTDAFTEASKKRKIDAAGKAPAGKTPVKHVKVPGKEKAESMKVVVPRTKSGSK
jgi:hypothetical protein